MPDQKPKNHHYVAQGYMRGFCENENVLYAYDKDINRIRTTSPKGVAYTPNFYKVDTIDEKDSDEIEKTLGIIESVSIPIIQKVTKGEPLDRNELADLAIYISIQYGRTPHSRMLSDHVASIIVSNEAKMIIAEMANNPEGDKYKELMDYFKQEHPDVDPPTSDKLIEVLTDSKPLYSVNVDNGTFVKSFFERVEVIGNGLLSKRWLAYQAPQNSCYITTDNPIGLHVDRELENYEMLAILLPGVVRYFPLDSKHCLVILDEEYIEGIAYKKISKAEVRRINKILFNQSRKYVISGNKPLLESLIMH